MMRAARANKNKESFACGRPRLTWTSDESPVAYGLTKVALALAVAGRLRPASIDHPGPDGPVPVPATQVLSLAGDGRGGTPGSGPKSRVARNIGPRCELEAWMWIIANATGAAFCQAGAFEPRDIGANAADVRTHPRSESVHFQGGTSSERRSPRTSHGVPARAHARPSPFRAVAHTFVSESPPTPGRCLEPERMRPRMHQRDTPWPNANVTAPLVPRGCN